MQCRLKPTLRSTCPRLDILIFLWLGILQIILTTFLADPARCSSQAQAEPAQAEQSRAGQSDPGQADGGADGSNLHRQRKELEVENSREQLSQWIRQLDDDRYLLRESAQQHLLAAGGSALAIVSATAASKNTSLESATRTVRILTTWSHSKETSLQLAALESLAALDNHPVEAAMASEVLAVLHEKIAIESIERLGGQCSLASIPAVIRSQSSLRVTIGPHWKGTDDDLELIRKIRGTSIVVSFHSAPVGDQALARLTDIEHLTRVEIYGTPYSQTAMDSLRKVLPGENQIDVRSGAKLGVAGSAAPPGIQGDKAEGGARIDHVQKGTAAHKAELRPHDIILQLDGEKVNNFQSLTRRIAAHQPGDTVVLTVMRGQRIAEGKVLEGKKLSISVTFDRWGGAGKDARSREK